MNERKNIMNKIANGIYIGRIIHITGKQQGAIAGISVKDMQGTGSAYTWLDANNTTIGNVPDIQNLKKGSYRLKATDGLGCTVTSASSFPKRSFALTLPNL